ncbi:hypothetical protein ABES02_10665 [Neobacillus pocheonensis]|uniref:hypothetical protein n=1 Tax=Neobacillus pocheonensis TaxID=363869 RepID=UPI003D2C44A9
MKKAFLFLFAVGFILSFDGRALAEEGHSLDQKMNHENMDHESMNNDGMDHESMNHETGNTATSSEHANHGEGQQSNMEGMNHDNNNDMEGMNMDGNGGHDHHAPVVESLPNYKVLGTFGAVNLSFILIGVWNKWFRRKGLTNGNA